MLSTSASLLCRKEAHGWAWGLLRAFRGLLGAVSLSLPPTSFGQGGQPATPSLPTLTHHPQPLLKSLRCFIFQMGKLRLREVQALAPGTQRCQSPVWNPGLWLAGHRDANSTSCYKGSGGWGGTLRPLLLGCPPASRQVLPALPSSGDKPYSSLCESLDGV